METEDFELSQFRIPDTDGTELAPITEVGLLTPQLIELYVARKTRPKLLNLTCGRSECDAELHTFRPLGIDITATGVVPCTTCGTELAGWDPHTLRECQWTSSSACSSVSGFGTSFSIFPSRSACGSLLIKTDVMVLLRGPVNSCGPGE